MATEVEAKFLADGDEPLDALAVAETLGRASLGPAVAVDEVDIYLDTRDGRLADAGWACRHRDRGGGPIVSLKGPPTTGTGPTALHRRLEIEGPATSSHDPRDWPVSDARDHLLDLSAGAPLIERVRLLQRRTERPVEVEGRMLGLLSLDAVNVVDAGGRQRGTLRVVELELRGGEDTDAEAQLSELAVVLGARPGLVTDDRSKLEHAMALVGDTERADAR